MGKAAAAWRTARRSSVASLAPERRQSQPPGRQETCNRRGCLWRGTCHSAVLAWGKDLEKHRVQRVCTLRVTLRICEVRVGSASFQIATLSFANIIISGYKYPLLLCWFPPACTLEDAERDGRRALERRRRPLWLPALPPASQRTRWKGCELGAVLSAGGPAPLRAAQCPAAVAVLSGSGAGASSACAGAAPPAEGRFCAAASTVTHGEMSSSFTSSF